MFQLKKFENYKTFQTTQYNFNALKLHVIYIEIRRVSVVLLYMQNEAMDNNKILYTIVGT